MKSYIYKRNKDGIHYLDLAKTWEKLMVAARIIAAAQAKNPKDVLVSTTSVPVRTSFALGMSTSRLIDYN